jgi:hypothetical protein
MCVSDRDEIARALLSYLFENTAARDSLEGIVEWWLLDRKIRQTTSAVKDVLDELVAKKLILEYEKGDGRVHYCVNRRKEEEIRVLLKIVDR